MSGERSRMRGGRYEDEEDQMPPMRKSRPSDSREKESTLSEISKRKREDRHKEKLRGISDFEALSNDVSDGGRTAG